jgi:hypothetical protein
MVPWLNRDLPRVVNLPTPRSTFDIFSWLVGIFSRLLKV